MSVKISELGDHARGPFRVTAVDTERAAEHGFTELAEVGRVYAVARPYAGLLLEGTAVVSDADGREFFAVTELERVDGERPGVLAFEDFPDGGDGPNPNVVGPFRVLVTSPDKNGRAEVGKVYAAARRSSISDEVVVLASEGASAGEFAVEVERVEEESTEAAAPKVGDRVRVTEWAIWNAEHPTGAVGKLVEIDPRFDANPEATFAEGFQGRYFVHFDTRPGERFGGSMWANRVERVEPVEPEGLTFAAAYQLYLREAERHRRAVEEIWAQVRA